MRKHPEAFAHIRQEKKFKTLAEHVHAAEQLAKRHGKLPGPGWLQKNGYSGLAAVLRKYPEAFAQIPQNKKFRTLSEKVALAEQLAKKHGKLPSPVWLYKHDRGLYNATRTDPESFRPHSEGEEIQDGCRTRPHGRATGEEARQAAWSGMA